MPDRTVTPDRRMLPDRRVLPDRRARAHPAPTPAIPAGIEPRLGLAFELAPIGLAQVTLEERWIAANQRLIDFLGYSRDELQQLRSADFTHPDDVAADRAGRARLLAGEIPYQRIEKRYIRKDGTIVWGALTVTLVRTAAGAPDYLFASVEDITDRKRAEEALRASETRYEDVAANVPGMVYQFVLRPDGSVALPYVGEGARELFGLAPEAVRQNPSLVFDIIHPADRPSWEAAVAASATALAPWRWEGRFMLPTGEEKWLQGSARPSRQPDGSTLWNGLLVDVTEQRHAVALLELSELRYRSLVEHHPDAVFSLDLDGRFLSANPGSETLSGYRPDELVGQPFDPLVVPEHLDAAHRAFEAAVAGQASTYELTIRHRSGRTVEISVTSIPIVVDERVVGVFGMAKDLTTQHSLEAQLRQAQKMEAVGRLAGGIAHDFNNLLTTMLATAELVLSESTTDAAVREDVETIRQTAERAAELTRQLLAFSRQQAVKPRPVDLNAIVQGTERMLRRTIGEGITLQLDLEPALGRVLADPGQIEQALVNLVVNARDAMPRGGRLVLRTRPAVVDEASAANRRGLHPGTYITLAVEDTGAGISPELQPRIFEPFFTTKPLGQGTGLGLATVYAMVEQYGGYTEVRSAPGEGTTFTIYLPRVEGGSRPDAPTATERRPQPQGTETILVVEDEAGVRRSVRRMLTRHGYTVLEAAHGAQALRMLEESERPIDLVLTDLVMPVMDGRELITALRARHPAPKIVAMSGYDRKAAMQGEVLPPDVSFVEKPFVGDELLRSVRAVLDAAPSVPR